MFSDSSRLLCCRGVRRFVAPAMLLLVLAGCARKFGSEDPIIIGDGSLYIRTPGRKIKDHMFLGRIHHRNRKTVQARFGRAPLPPQDQPCAGAACREEACDNCEIRIVFSEPDERAGKTIRVAPYSLIFTRGLEISTNGQPFSGYEADGDYVIFQRGAKVASITVDMTSYADCGQPCEIRIHAPK